MPRLRKVFAAVRSAWRLSSFAGLSVERGVGSFRGGRALSVAAFWAGAAHPRRQKHREMPPPGASAPAFAATVEPVSMQTVYGETHRQRVMERVLKMCCRVLPVYAFFAALIANSGSEIKNRCTEVPEMIGCAAVIANSGLKIRNRCTEVPEMIGCAAVIANSGLEIRNRCTKVPEMTGCAAVIANSGPEIENRCTDYSCFDLLSASIRKSGLEIENRCTDCPCFDLMAASIRMSGPEIENRCSAIVPASRTARLQRSRGAQAGTGCHEGGIILSKKPPEWHLATPQQRSASDSNLRCRKVERPACISRFRQAAATERYFLYLS